MQVDTRERGFSYAYDAPLDMRMDPAQELTAAELVNTWDRRRLARVLREYGEERYAERIAGQIVRRRAAHHHVRARRRDHRRDPGARPLRRRPPRQADLPGDPDRRQRRARPARRGAAARLGRARGRRPPGRDLVPLARGPAREALPRRARRAAASARPTCRSARAAARRRPSRCSALGGADAGRGRRQPALEVGPPAGRPQAQGGALDMPRPPPARAASATRRRRVRRRHGSASRARRGPAPAAGAAVRPRHDRRLRAHPRAPRDPARRRPPARPRVDLADRPAARRDRRHAGLAAQAQRRHLARGHDATLERQNADLEAGIARMSSGDRVRAEALNEGMVSPLPGGVEYLTARGERDATRARPPDAAAQRGGRVDHGARRPRAGRAARRSPHRPPRR